MEICMNYQPNPKNKAFIRRANLALAFVDTYVKNTPNWLSQKWIEDPKHFGSHRNELSAWLKAQLLVCVDPHFNYLTGKCKKYVKNAEGYKLVTDLLAGNTTATELTNRQQQELDTGKFDYTSKSLRDYTWAQFLPKRKRNSILNNNGYKYHYDIESAAPTLLLQSARCQNPSLLAQNLEYYINNRSEMREKIAVACHITEEQVKGVVNSILQGGIISGWESNKTFNEILNRNYSAVHLLNTNKDIIALKQDIRDLWASLRGVIPVRYTINKQGISQRAKISSREKSDYYRLLEQQVSKPIRKYLKKKSVRVLWIHDGWACDEAIEPSEIVQVVKKQTGYAIKLDWTIYEG